MRQDRFFPTDVWTTGGNVQTGIVDVSTNPVTVYLRPPYSAREAQQVTDWLNGKDQPLNIVPRSVDPFDPVRIQARRVK